MCTRPALVSLVRDRKNGFIPVIRSRWQQTRDVAMLRPKYGENVAPAGIGLHFNALAAC